MKMLIMEKKPVSVVADRFGVNRSTIWRWHQRWLALNQDRQFTNDNRLSRPVGPKYAYEPKNQQ